MSTTPILDHHSLKYLKRSSGSHLKCSAKWVAKLMGYDYEINHNRGTDNSANDALSRQMEGPMLLFLVLYLMARDSTSYYYLNSIGSLVSRDFIPLLINRGSEIGSTNHILGS